MAGGKSQSEHILDLCRELLDDIELDRLEAEKLVLKCSRLARLVGSDEILTWLQYELRGYNSTDKISLKYIGRTGRWIDVEKKQAYWGPLAAQEAIIKTSTAQLSGLTLPNVSGDYVAIALSQIMQKQDQISGNITTCSRIRSTVVGLLHTFVAETYHEREFAGLAESIFERYKRDIDALIAGKAGGVLSKIPAVIDRLAIGDQEGVSQALSTCRRIIDAFADAIYPPTDATIDIGGNTLKLDASKHQNRINAYVAARATSTSRRQKIRQNLSNLYDRVATGVHKDVTAEEAFSLFLNVYLLLGEILHLEQAAPAPVSAPKTG